MATMPPVHDMAPSHAYPNEEGRILQQPFPFPPMLIPPPQMDHAENIPTDLRVLSTKTGCPCTTPNPDEPQNLAYRPRYNETKGNSDHSDNDSDTEIDLTSHSSKDDELRESERLANRIANSIFRSTQAVLQDMVPNDLSLNSIKNIGSRSTIQM